VRKTPSKLMHEASLVYPDVRARYTRRVCAHEGWHAVLDHRGEDVGRQLIRIDGAQDERDGFLHAAARVIEEYRVERAIWEDRSLLHDDGGRKPDSLVGEMVSELYPVQPSEPAVDPESFNWLVVRLGYLAADRVVSGADPLAHLAGSREWSHVIGQHWQMLCVELRPIPSAAGRADPEELDAFVVALASHLKGWIRDLGIDPD
jgi:hypothetical protein